MRAPIALVAALFLTWGAHAAPHLITSTSHLGTAAGGVTTSTALPVSVPANTLIAVPLTIRSGSGTGTITACTDTNSDSYKPIDTGSDTNGNSMLFAAVTTSVATGLVVTCNGTPSATVDIVVMAFSGVGNNTAVGFAASGPLTDSNTTTEPHQLANPPISGTIAAGDLVISEITFANNLTVTSPGAPWSIVGINYADVGYAVAGSSPATFSPSYSAAAGAYSWWIVAFAPATGGAPQIVCTLETDGVGVC